MKAISKDLNEVRAPFLSTGGHGNSNAACFMVGELSFIIKKPVRFNSMIFMAFSVSRVCHCVFYGYLTLAQAA